MKKTVLTLIIFCSFFGFSQNPAKFKNGINTEGISTFSADVNFDSGINLNFGNPSFNSEIRAVLFSTIWNLIQGDLEVRDNNAIRFTFNREFGDFSATGSGIFGDGIDLKRNLIVNGVGNATPSLAGGLQLQTTAGGGLDIHATSSSGNPIWDFRTFASEQMSFSPNSVEAMRFDASGNVGMGVAIPEALLHAGAADGIIGEIKVEGGKNTVTSIGEINSQFLFGSNDASVNSADEIGGKISSITESTTGSRTGLGFSTFDQVGGLTENMRLDWGGKLGLGTTLPISKLHLYEDNVSTNGTTGITVEQDGIGDSHINFVLTGTETFSVGIDNSDSDKFKISQSDILGVNDVFIIDDGSVSIGEELVIPKKLSVSETNTTQTGLFGAFEFRAISNYGSLKSILSHKQGINEVVINEDSVDLDFRVRGTTNPSLFVVDAGLNQVSIDGVVFTGDSEVEDTGTFKTLKPLIDEFDSITLSLDDRGTIINFEDNSGGNITIPTNAAVPFKIGAEITLINFGTGTMTIVGPGVIIRENIGGLSILTDDKRTLTKIRTNTWNVGL